MWKRELYRDGVRWDSVGWGDGLFIGTGWDRTGVGRGQVAFRGTEWDRTHVG